MKFNVILLIIFFLLGIENLNSFPGSFQFQNSIGKYQLNIYHGIKSFGDTIIFQNIVYDTVLVWDQSLQDSVPYEKIHWDICFYVESTNELKTFDFSKMVDSIDAKFLYDVIKISPREYFLAINDGIIKFNIDSSKFYKLGGYLRSLEYFKDTLYICGSRVFITKYFDGKFTNIYPDTSDGTTRYDWTPTYMATFHRYRNRLYFENSKYLYAYYDLDSSKIYKSGFDTIQTFFKDETYLRNPKEVNDTFNIIVNSNNNSYIVKYDGEHYDVENSMKSVFAPDSTPFNMLKFYKGINGYDFYQIQYSELIKAYDYIVDKDNNSYRINAGKVLHDPKYDALVMNAMPMPDGKIYLGLSDAGFLVYDPNGTGVEKTDISTIMVYNSFPNPAKNKIKVEFTNWTRKYDEISTELYNYLGERIAVLYPESFDIWDDSIGYGTMQLDMTGVSQGAYYLVIRNNTDMRTVPVIKE